MGETATTTRTDAEIVERMNSEEVTSRDALMGIERSDLLGYLSFEHAQPFLKDGVTEEQWNPASRPRDRESILAEMKEYMPFAFEKAHDERGLSAYRSMSHYSAWVWLVGDNLGDLCESDNYGIDNLIRICEHYGWDHTEWSKR